MRAAKKVVFAAVMGGLVAAAPVGAEERLGVKVYQGAKLDADNSAMVREMMQSEAFCYATGDGLSQVAAFYRKEGYPPVGSATSEAAMFRKGAIDITVQSPWMNMKTGTLVKTTLLCIVKTKK